MSSWRKIAFTVFDLNEFLSFGVSKFDGTIYGVPEHTGKYIIRSETKDHESKNFNIYFETQQEAMEYLIKALREDICP